MEVNVWKLQLVKESDTRYNESVTGSQAVVELLRNIGLDREPEEVVMLLCFNNRNKIVGVHEISRGTVNASICVPRDVYKRALLNNANGIIVCHNHPSGETDPSREDMDTAKALKEAGKLLKISLLDFIVLGESGEYRSFENAGIL